VHNKFFETKEEALLENQRYRQYREMGGIINEKDFTRVLNEAADINSARPNTLLRHYAQKAGIEVTVEAEKIYTLLRDEVKPKDVDHHHAQMSDQQLLAEVLRMLGDSGSLARLKQQYPMIN